MKGASMSKFELKKSKDGQYMFTLIAPNGEVILTSERYTAKSNAKNGIESVKKNAKIDKRFVRKESTSGKPYFVLKAGNNQVIGNSEMYSSKSSRESGIESVKKNAPRANINDLT